MFVLPTPTGALRYLLLWLCTQPQHTLPQMGHTVSLLNKTLNDRFRIGTELRALRVCHVKER